MTNLEKTILIDRYLAGEMTEEEKVSFERLLSDTDSSYTDKVSLKDEMNLQKEIILAIQERGLREMLQREEAKIKEEEEHHRRIRRITLWSLSAGGTSSAIAAVLAFILVISPMAQLMQDYSNQYIAGVEVYASRGDDELTQSLNEALLLMQSDQWNEAEKIVDAVYQPTTNADVECQDQYDEAEWLKTVCLMHRGKTIRAKRMLRKIANSDSHYQSRAAELLKSL